MPQVLVPGVAQTRILGTVSGVPFVNVWHWSNGSPGSPWTSTNMNNLVSSVGQYFQSGFSTFFSTNVSVTGTDGVDIGTTTPNTAAFQNHAFTGTATGVPLASQVAIVVSFLTNVRYRGGHARTYLPPTSETFATAGQNAFTVPFTQSVASAFATMVTNVVAAVPGTTHCVPMYTYTYSVSPSGKKIMVQRSGLKGVHTVSAYRVLTPFGTQRRRVSSS